MVLAADNNILAPTLIDADIGLELPSIHHQNYIGQLENLLKTHEIDAVISLNDLELPVLASYRDRLSSKSCKILVPDKEVIDICFDKWKTHTYLKGIGLNSPSTFLDYNQAKKAIERGKLKFPLVVKPRWGSASMDISFPQNMEELELSYRLLTMRLDRDVGPNGDERHIGESVIIQEKIEAAEYGMDILNDFEGNYFGSYAREKLAIRAGETDKAKSVIDNDLLETGKILGENLGHIGSLDCDVFIKDGTVFVLELNPRFGGGYPFSHEAGINIAAIYISWLSGITDVDRFDNYVEDKIFSKCDRMIELRDRSSTLTNLKTNRDSV